MNTSTTNCVPALDGREGEGEGMEREELKSPLWALDTYWLSRWNNSSPLSSLVPTSLHAKTRRAAKAVLASLWKHQLGLSRGLPYEAHVRFTYEFFNSHPRRLPRRKRFGKDALRAALKWLVEEGLVEVVPGYLGKASYVKATDKLLALIEGATQQWPQEDEPLHVEQGLIIIRDEDKHEIDVRPDGIEEMEEALALFNLSNARHEFVLEGVGNIPDIKWNDLGSRAPNGDILLAPSEIVYRRVFNNSCLHHGGRYYNGLTSAIPTPYRKRLRIDGEPAVECDFSQLHPRLVYHLHNLIPPDECYIGEKGTPERELSKAVLLVLLNCNEEQLRPGRFNGAVNSRWQKTRNKWQLERQYNNHFDLPFNKPKPISRWPRHTVIQQLEAAKEKHPLFAKVLGVELQNIDARIATSVFERLSVKGIGVLGWHDGFYVARSHVEELKRAIRDAYREHVHNSIPDSQIPLTISSPIIPI